MAEKTEKNPKGSGAPLGNQNSSMEKRIFANAIRKKAIQDKSRRLHSIAEILMQKAEEGDMAAIREVGDRLDGKAMQGIEADVRGAIVLTLSADDAEL